MPSAVRRSEELQKRIQRRKNSLTPADLAKERISFNEVEAKPDPVEKSKAALSDIRKRIDERKKLSTIDVKQYQEKREEGVVSDSAIARRQEPAGTLKTYYKDHKNSRTNVYTERVQESDEEPHIPPTQIEIRSSIDSPRKKRDDDTEVSEITTDVQIMSTKGASYAERRMAGNVQKKLANPALSTPTGRALERDVNISVNNIRDLGKAVEQAKLDMQKQLSPVNDTTTHGVSATTGHDANDSTRNGLPYESTDYEPSQDEGDSWGDAIRTSSYQEQKQQYIADKYAAKKLQTLVKDAVSCDGDVIIDATGVREEDLDGDESKEGCDGSTIGSAQLREIEKKLDEKLVTSAQEEKKMVDMDDDNAENDAQPKEDSEKEPSNSANNPVDMASEFYNSSVDFFKSFGSQVDAQLKLLQKQGFNKNVEGIIGGILNREENQTQDVNDGIINFDDDFEVAPSMDEHKNNSAGPNLDSVGKMLESIGISKCGIDSDLINENKKAIEKMVADLKNGNGGPGDDDQVDDASAKLEYEIHEDDIDEIDGDVLKELTDEDSPDKPVPLAGAKGGNKTFMLSFSVPGFE